MAHSRHPAHTPPGVGVELIIVDDDLYVRTALAAALHQRGGLTVHGTYPDGRTAVDAVQILTPTPGVALVDIAMPNMAGPETVRHLIAAAPTMKVLALTSIAEPEAAEAMLSAGAAGFLTKDTPVPAMIHTIRAAFAGLTVLSEPAAALLSITGSHLAAPSLPAADLDLIRRVSAGQSNQQIADALYLSLPTVKKRLARLMHEMDATNRVTLAVRAHEMGYLRTGPVVH